MLVTELIYVAIDVIWPVFYFWWFVQFNLFQKIEYDCDNKYICIDLSKTVAFSSIIPKEFAGLRFSVVIEAWGSNFNIPALQISLIF